MKAFRKQYKYIERIIVMTKPISEKISELRKSCSLTQEQLGAKLGVSNQAVSKWEKGESMPDIMLLPKLCSILGISIDSLLEMPEKAMPDNIVSNFCRHAEVNGKSSVLIDAFSRMFHNSDKSLKENWVEFGANYLRIFDDYGMGFVVAGKDYLDACLNGDMEDILYIMRILCSENLLSVLRIISIDKAVTREEIAALTGLDEDAINRILTGFFKRGIIVCEKDSSGKRGYLQGDAMAGIYMILAGCQVLSDNGAINGYKRFTRMSEETP